MLYDYRCQAKHCKKPFTVEVIGMSKYEKRRVAKVHCPHCKSTNVKKIISTPTIVFKGKGFYSNDKSTKQA